MVCDSRAQAFWVRPANINPRTIQPFLTNERAQFVPIIVLPTPLFLLLVKYFADAPKKNNASPKPGRSHHNRQSLPNRLHSLTNVRARRRSTVLCPFYRSKVQLRPASGFAQIKARNAQRLLSLFGVAKTCFRGSYIHFERRQRYFFFKIFSAVDNYGAGCVLDGN
jgi:hypothetical protein